MIAETQGVQVHCPGPRSDPVSTVGSGYSQPTVASRDLSGVTCPIRVTQCVAGEHLYWYTAGATRLGSLAY
eukprot:1996236-Rhodomonas_salina.2